MQIRTAPGRYEYRATLTNPNQQWGSTAPPPNSAGGQQQRWQEDKRVALAGANLPEHLQE